MATIEENKKTQKNQLQLRKKLLVLLKVQILKQVLKRKLPKVKQLVAQNLL